MKEEDSKPALPNAPAPLVTSPLSASVRAFYNRTMGVINPPIPSITKWMATGNSLRQSQQLHTYMPSEEFIEVLNWFKKEGYIVEFVNNPPMGVVIEVSFNSVLANAKIRCDVSCYLYGLVPKLTLDMIEKIRQQLFL